jgi:hypothetical protein
MGLRYATYAFTEDGVAQLSTVLNSERAIKVRRFIEDDKIIFGIKNLIR